MKKVLIFLTEGFEEMEAATPVDLLRRAGVDCKTVSMTGKREVTGAHGISFVADLLFDEEVAKAADGIVLPGGMPGTANLQKHQGLKKVLRYFDEEKKLISAICAAPMILGEMGLVKGREATIYPGMEDFLTGALPVQTPICKDGHILTSRAPGTAIPFALKLVEIFAGAEVMETVRKDIVYGE